jgi:hypothetical protein
MSGETLHSATPYFRLFPNARDVFASDVELYAEYILPLATVDLSHLNADWRGAIHFVAPIESSHDLPGELTSKHHTYLCRTNWLGYRINDEDRYTLDCDFCYFLKFDLESRTQLHAEERHKLEELRGQYQATKESYFNEKRRFERFGGFYLKEAETDPDLLADEYRNELVQDLGGTPGWPNWAEMNLFPLRKEQEMQSDGELGSSAFPVANGPGKFEFIGWLPTYSYSRPCAYNLYLFYNHEARLALTTFDWS